MDIIFKGRHTDVQERFRERATAKLTRVGKLDQKAIRVDVEVSAEHNPRQADRRERVELTITSRGPAIRAEAAGQDRFAALDLALAKLESRLRRAGDRRKARRAVPPVSRPGEPGEPGEQEPAAGEPAGPGQPARIPVPPARSGSPAGPPASTAQRTAAPTAERTAMAGRGTDGSKADGRRAGRGAAGETTIEPAEAGDAITVDDDLVPIQMEGDGPLVVREKFHLARPMAIDQALFEMELVGHDFFLFRDAGDGCPSVVYRRRGYQYGVIRLVEEAADARHRGAVADSPAEGLRRASDAAAG